MTTLQSLNLPLTHIPAGIYTVGADEPILARPPKYDFIETLATPLQQIKIDAFTITTDVIRLSHWEKISETANLVDLLPPDHLDSLRAEIDTDTIATVHPTGGDKQVAFAADEEVHSHEVPRDPIHDPVLRATSEQAEAIATALGAELPNWHEWEAATRGPEGLLYPWGNAFDLSKLTIEEQDYSMDDEGVMGYYSYDQYVYFIHSFGEYVDQPSPFGLTGFAGPAREWNRGDGLTEDGEHILRSISDLGGMAMMIPGIRPNSWGMGGWHQSKRQIAFSAPSLPCYVTESIASKPYPDAGFRLVFRHNGS